MSSLFDTLVAPGKLTVRFQPIFRVEAAGRRVHAFECLNRGPRDTNMENSAVLFEYVRRKGKEAAIDRVCVANALQQGEALQRRGASLSLNVHAATLERDPGFPDFLANLAEARQMATTALVVEIVEHAPTFGGSRLRIALERLRLMGVKIALDDVGIGQSNFRMILDCDPEYLKADRYLVQGCHHDRRRRVVLESLVHLARRLGAQVVAEGVEEAAELDAVVGMGIDLVQGYLLARPLPVEELESAWPGEILEAPPATDATRRSGQPARQLSAR